MSQSLNKCTKPSSNTSVKKKNHVSDRENGLEKYVDRTRRKWPGEVKCVTGCVHRMFNMMCW